MRARPSGEAGRIARAVAMHDRNESHHGRRADQRGDEPFLKPVKQEVEERTETIVFGYGGRGPGGRYR